LPKPHGRKSDRYQVTVEIEFREVIHQQNYQAPLGAQKINEKIWHTSIYVKDKKTFEKCLDWKYNNTTTLWDAYDRELESD